MNRTEILRWPFLIPMFLICIHAVYVRAEALRQGPSAPLTVIQPAPEFSLENVLGGQVHSRDLKGKVVVVEFWATWAVPAVSSMPEYNELRKKLKDQGVEVLAVTFDSGSAARVAATVKELQIEFPVVMGTADVDKAFGGHPGLPTTFLIGKDWKVYRRIFGRTQNKIQNLTWDVLSLLAFPDSEPEVPRAR